MTENKNPLSKEWYADPEARTYDGVNYIYVTRSLPFEQQTNLDCVWFGQDRELHTEKGILDMSGFPYVTHAVWAPTVIDKNGKYYLIFASNNIQKDEEPGGLEIAVSDDPKGPFRGYLGKPLLDHFVFGAQPIDAHLFKDDDGRIYLYFGGWRHCVVALMNDRMDGFSPLPDGEIFKEITPKDYVEGPCMLKRKNDYPFMYSTGGWTNSSYGVLACRADSPFGPFEEPQKVLFSQPPVAEGPGHHGYLQTGEDQWKIVYHRRLVGDLNPHDRILCMDDLYFDGQGNILPVKMT